MLYLAPILGFIVSLILAIVGVEVLKNSVDDRDRDAAGLAVFLMLLAFGSIFVQALTLLGNLDEKHTTPPPPAAETCPMESPLNP